MIEENIKSDDTKEKTNNLPMVEETMTLSTTAPVRDIFVDEAKASEADNRYQIADPPAMQASKVLRAGSTQQMNDTTKIQDIKYEMEDDEEINKRADYPVLPSRRGDVLGEILPKLDLLNI